MPPLRACLLALTLCYSLAATDLRPIGKHSVRPPLPSGLRRLSGGETINFEVNVREGTDYEEMTTVEETDAARERTELEKIYCEGIGTFILTLAVACVGAQGTPLAPVAVACVLTGLIYAFGKLSMAIFNPSVTVALLMRGKLTVSTALKFTLVQLVASIAAGLAAFFIYGKSAGPALSAAAATGMRGLLRAGFTEVLFTGVIVNAVCHAGLTRVQRDNDVVGLAIGLTVLGCAICADFSGGCFNPALGIGLQISRAIVGGGFPARDAAVYLLAPPIGAVLATLAFQHGTCPDEP